MKKLHSLHNSNEGVALVTVIVFVAFVSMLGVTLMFSAYTGVKIKTVERAGRDNFYSAEAVMNQLRSGVEEVVSDAVAGAYSRVLVDYRSAADVSANSFGKYFVSELCRWEKRLDPATDKIFLSVPACSMLGGLDVAYKSDGGRFDIEVLKSMAESGAGISVTAEAASVSEPGMGRLTCVDRPTVDADGNALPRDGVFDEFVLENITVTFTENGYETSVTSDISILLPEIVYSGTSSLSNEFSNFVIIARNELRPTSAVSALGNIYADTLSVSVSDAKLTVGGDGQSYSVICGKKALVEGDRAELMLGAGAQLWSGDVECGRSGSLIIQGNAYVADDLELSGSAASVTLSGKYYGFGCSADNATKSSSIIVNGVGTKLDMSALKGLTVAGHAFVATGAHYSGNTDVMMGESLTVRENQLAYLIPLSCLREDSVTANPMVYDTGSLPSAETLKACVDTAAPLWGEEGGRTLTADDVKLVYYPLTASNQTLVYFYMSFADTDAANAYFSEYFTRNPEKAAGYLSMYSDVLSASAAAVGGNLGGYGVYYNEAGAVSAINPTAILESDMLRYDTMFKNVTRTLTTGQGAADGVTPYTYYVNQDSAEGLCIADFTDGSAKYFSDAISAEDVGVAVDGDFIVDSSDAKKNLHVVVATGAVTVNRDFVGLIISGGNVTVSSVCTLTADASTTFETLAAASADGEKLYKYLKNTGISDDEDAVSASDNYWDPSKLVIYKNWSKNEQ